MPPSSTIKAGDIKFQSQAQIDRKRSLVEQALETSFIELKKPRKENPKKPKEKKEKSMAMKKVVQMATLRTKEQRNLEALKKNRPPLPKLKIDKANKIAAMEREANQKAMMEKEAKKDDVFHPLTNPEGSRGDWIDFTLPNTPPPPNACDNKKEEEWVQILCPDGKEGCEVLHMIKRFPPVTAAPPVNSPVIVPPPVNSLVKPNDWMNPIDPDEIQSINAIHDTTFARGMASTKQLYWCLVIDAIVIALARYYHEMCEGCKTDSRKKHDLCDLPVKTVWAKNRKAILTRVGVAPLMGKWTSAVYTSRGIRPSEIESLFNLCDPRTMFDTMARGFTRW